VKLVKFQFVTMIEGVFQSVTLIEGVVFQFVVLGFFKQGADLQLLRRFLRPPPLILSDLLLLLLPFSSGSTRSKNLSEWPLGRSPPAVPVRAAFLGSPPPQRVPERLCRNALGIFP